MAGQERLECAGEWDRALLPVFGAKRRRLLDGQKASLQVEPPRPRLDDLVLAQAGVEAQEEDQLHVVGHRAGDELVAQGRRAELIPPLRVVAVELDLRHRVATHLALGDQPVEEAPRRHDVALRRGLGHAAL